MKKLPHIILFNLKHLPSIYLLTNKMSAIKDNEKRIPVYNAWKDPVLPPLLSPFDSLIVLDLLEGLGVVFGSKLDFTVFYHKTTIIVLNDESWYTYDVTKQDQLDELCCDLADNRECCDLADNRECCDLADN